MLNNPEECASIVEEFFIKSPGNDGIPVVVVVTLGESFTKYA